MSTDWASYVNTTRSDNVEKAKSAGKTGAGGSVLEAMALVLGEIADNMAKAVIDKAKELDGSKGAGNENELTAQLQVLTQQLNMFIQAMNNAIKTLGEANGTVARKG